MKWLKKRDSRVDTEELQQKAAVSLQRTEAQQPKVNYITTWLNNRKDDNGLGEDFEITLRHPRKAT